MPAKLSDLQLVLLASAAARVDGSLLPPPASVGDQLARIRNAVPVLLKRGLVAEAAVTDLAQAWRHEDDRHIGALITAAGQSAIRVEMPAEGDESSPAVAGDAASKVPVVAEAAAPRPTKTAQVLTLLRREQGATLAELVTATGWLPHTTRAALTGLRKKAHAIERDKRGDITCYRIAGAA